ncbi:leucine efflux protein LeuE [Spongiactinospora sp. TRM90649]|uniref:leucine efflux protein LeuE n=1 Tax=Spongiactinospora sp. TRM90649 TaxID=3031114 RepID=UPI0023F6C911|nr:leucine efflux protein LeuE [Spongiactinospora sp. TRM90649]MDF5752761.1 leucine efflux protein LeuE [Spongiactinospora sp. TRM90649]
MFFGITDIWTYVVGAFLIILLPGPNSVYVLTTAAQRGVRAGYQAALGVFLGDTVLMFLAAAGVASLLRSNAVLFSIVKYAGAVYLAWIGFQMLRSAWRSWRAREDDGRAAEGHRPARRPFTRALAISLLNPKAILFFVSFFIQFVDPSYGAPALSFLILGAICQFFSVLYLSALIFGGTFLSAQFSRRRRLSAGLTSAVGALFVAFGARLAM